MTVVAIDTNVILDFILQRAAVTQYDSLFHAAEIGRTALYMPLAVALETEWVLRRVYKQPKTTVLKQLDIVFELPAMSDVPLGVFERTLALYRSTSGVSFDDCLIAATCEMHGVDELVTGDKKLAKLYRSLKKGRR